MKPRILRAFEALPEVRVLLYEPAGAPEAKSMPVGTKRSELTVTRAVFLQLLHRYLEPAERLTLLEVQKLAYFLQEAGEPLRLKYEAHLYGPYAQALNPVLERLEGHYLRGTGDLQKPDADLELMEGAAEAAESMLAGHDASRGRLSRVVRLMEGFETPYGMELLASLHWLGTRGSPPAGSCEEALAGLARWSERKRRLFSPGHASVA